jgi:hypothetical protein
MLNSNLKLNVNLIKLTLLSKMGNKISVDLLDVAGDHMNLLVQISCNPPNETTLKNAIDRYIRCMREDTVTYDLHSRWIFYVHKMRPIAYRSDMLQLQQNASNWTPSIDLFKASIADCEFVSSTITKIMPSEYNKYISDYKKFFKTLKNREPFDEIPIEIEFMWRTHIYDNKKYLSDCKRILKRYVDHNYNIQPVRELSRIPKLSKCPSMVVTPCNESPDNVNPSYESYTIAQSDCSSQLASLSTFMTEFSHQ